MWCDRVLYEEYSLIPEEERYCLRKLMLEWAKEEPLAGKNILLNCHLTRSTLVMLDALKLGGATVSATATDELAMHKTIISSIEASGVNYRPIQEITAKEKNRFYDVVVDCGAGLLGTVKPRYGMSELTQTNPMIYDDIDFPVMTIDRSALKKIETFYGTGDGFLRALASINALCLEGGKLSKRSKLRLRDKNIIVFGYGKVGSGIAWRLNESDIDPLQTIIIDPDEGACQRARKDGFKSMVLSEANLPAIRDLFKSAFCVVTVTGLAQSMSRFFSEDDFPSDVLLANMGTPDEWGDNFANTRILHGKKAINFSLDAPTKMIYLDPIFAALLAATKLVSEGGMPRGLNYLPQSIDQKICMDWSDYVGLGDQMDILHV